MSDFTWNPERYLSYADERGRPFLDLLARVPLTGPATVVDLGCGAGNLTRLLRERWPSAGVSGLDSSPEMIRRARADVPEIEFAVADAADGTPSAPVDVLISNAMLQWVPRHLDLLGHLLDGVAPGGFLAFQVPGNMAAPSHRLLAELAAEVPYREHTRGLPAPGAHDPQTYARRLLDLGCEVDAWETTYVHLLRGADPVFTWISGTGARPVLEALEDAGLREQFKAEFKRRLNLAYPPAEHGVLFPFRRIFVVAQKAAA